MEPYGVAHLLTTSVTLGAIILSTIVGNVFVIAAIVLERHLHQNAANYLIVSLAVADLVGAYVFIVQYCIILLHGIRKWSTFH